VNRERRLRFNGRVDREHRWVISYADFLTLLFAFFAFLFSISSLQNDKFKEVSATLLQLFDVKPTSVDPIEMQTTPEGPDIFNPLYKPEPLPGTDIDNAGTERYNTESSLLDIRKQLGETFAQLIEDQLFSVSGDESWIEIQLSDSITFLPGSADITDEAEAVLYEIGKILADGYMPVAVEGYSLIAEEGSTDGWALSSQRAVNVLRYLESTGVSGPRLSAVAFSHFQPNMSAVPTDAGRISIVVAGFEQKTLRP
jgi:chemotaxis protein MotB